MSLNRNFQQESAASVVWQFSNLHLAIIAGVAALLYFLYQSGIEHAIGKWNSPEYSHAYLIPLISLFILWQNYSKIQRSELSGGWLGVLILLFGLFLMMMGELSTLYVIVQYSLLLVLFGWVLSLTGISKVSLFLFPIVLLFFTVPLPNFLYNGLSSYLQLVSSKIGVEVIRLFGVSVHLEGNVIDLGAYQLQVVEACNGLRYLFPLVALGVITAYFYKEALWKKLVIVASTIPITVLMNSVRIGIIGVLVEYWGIEMAEGFLHDFEGWIIFMACFAILLLEMWLLTRFTSGRSLRDVLSIELPSAQNASNLKTTQRKLPRTFLISCTLISIVAVSSVLLPERKEEIPDRKSFTEFPLTVDEWVGSTKSMELKYINALKFEDYFLSNYVNKGTGLEFYMAYYDSQRKGESAHSPKSCLPGAGWRIASRTKENIQYMGRDRSAHTLHVNRMLVKRGDSSYLTYYWFKQRDRHLANEFKVKWYLFWDSLTKNRTDGALIRIIYPLQIGEDIKEADATVHSFLKRVAPLLPGYVPD